MKCKVCLDFESGKEILDGAYCFCDLEKRQIKIPFDFEQVFQKYKKEILAGEDVHIICPPNNFVESLTDWQKEIHELAKEKGWYENRRSDVEIISLMICEATEAIEQIRNEKPSYYEANGKPEGVAVEIADMIIRALDYAEYRGWDMQEIIKKKHEYNKTRPYKHGGKAL